MADRTHTLNASNSPSSYGWCRWHGGHAEDVQLIDVIEQGSRGGGGLFACPPCLEQHGLVPFADRPL
ncbi:hypothetical protein [Streptomyces ureilyticus]|uniref:Uncharacterized protein n=1 Tax=Streptomyces ureilyticus TaxID=1775131 RepID=A0ABX0DPI3_9ACTN|nr:hypothetical protein [Streptomyces ureilyticus]NGO43780.1 hypothetical protein [Streptomyces ureilyticus]